MDGRVASTLESRLDGRVAATLRDRLDGRVATAKAIWLPKPEIYTMSGKKGTDSTLDTTLTNSNIL